MTSEFTTIRKTGSSHLEFTRCLPVLLLLLALMGISSCSREAATAGAANAVPDPPFRLPERVGLEEATRRPRLVVFIVIDTLRADYMGAYGSRLKLTPCFDALASRSYLFENAMAPSSWTRPSVASMFTSCYPSSIGVLDREDVLGEDLLTLAEVLNVQGGYECIGITTNGNAGKEFGFAQGFNDFYMPKQKRGYPDDFKLIPADVLTRHAIKELNKWMARKVRKPMFLFLHYVDPHDPYLPHPGFLPTPEPKGRFNGSRPDLKKMDKTPLDELKAEDVKRIRYLYCGEIKFCDFWIGKLLAAIKSLGPDVFDHMMVIITADHGEGLWDHGYRAHGHILYEEQIRVPLLIRLPRMMRIDTKRISTRVSLVDLAPTVLSACGIPKPDQFQGHDLMPLIHTGNRGPEHDFIYSELKLGKRNYESIQWENRKLIRNRALPSHRSGALQLFDLSKDPKEKTNLSNSDEGVDWAGTMKKALRKWSDAIKAGNQYAQQIPFEHLDEETLNNLRALGYIGPDRNRDVQENGEDEKER